MNITDLKPTKVWKFFHEITQVPRPSKKEEKILAYLVKFAEDRNLKYRTDEVGNLVIEKPATPGYEHLETVILQSHMDMVCEKNADKVHDFENDPIRTIIDGEWLHADGTTLGADNGIGCAAELAILDSDDIEHGPIECLFTMDEETGMTGAMNLKPGFFNGKILLNLDSEDEGELFIGCAGGMGTMVEFAYEKREATDDYLYFEVKVSGLKGGHSGGEIHIGLGNANKILTRYLYALEHELDWKLCSFQGGNLHNAIPREAHAVIGLKADQKERARVILNELAAAVEDELKRVDPGVKLEMKSVGKPAYRIDCDTKRRLVRALYACPHGVYGMSHDIEGLVETSSNLASVKMKEDDKIYVETSQRSSTSSLISDIANTVASVFELADAKISFRDPYPGWKPNPDSPILKAASESYERIFGRKPAIKAIHAGLECGLFLDKYPYLDMVSFGPTLRDVHSPVEKIEIKTVQLWWDHLVDILKHIPAAK
ncbi:aminoacyl-histidine dipeptidase [Porphyromonas gingivalis W83]|uniref:Cytosol non-specific dipeptidase n=1 Tax=Porphyromonas gingivalis (strain ATCC BAA-308 / W83) TaxID=242619 RepID=Q7MWQ8_PORGI|nr:aminoacyl-histidine dipeptidase [Porphyromonas gingivalis]AAQ65729.1 aminoacyl-histidine dipeptidase [Porphyromonas gingivalis W83]AUR45817.1 aminoacyl-histidine dipeptidase [Porphyromonas gingivalis]EIW94859.1 Xaa-His dipeptidase [Porphyromonas gingivalis W50]USI93210.1 aminoacyl-histidine dipeptidase [Porphyromonas gingivalis]USI96389.1 aminoacyl-histidine dipeptidase [Porphyromonas gingivalis]